MYYRNTVDVDSILKHKFLNTFTHPRVSRVLFQRPNVVVGMQNPPRVQPAHVHRVRDAHVLGHVHVLQRVARLGPVLGAAAGRALVGVRQGRRHDVPAAAAGHAAGRPGAPEHGLL